MVTGVNTDIHENKTELYYEDEEGKRQSYSPRRYECEYEFNMTVLVNSPWFDKIELELSDGNRPDSPYTDLYRRYEAQMHTLSDMLRGVGNQAQNGFAAPKTREQEIMEGVIKNSSWVCKSCGLANQGTLTCQNCGSPMSDERVLNAARNIAEATLMMENTAPQGGAAPVQQSAPQNWTCAACGSENSGKFCENCGAPRA